MPRTRLLLRAAAWLALTFIAGVVLIGSAAFLYLSPDLPSVDVLRDVQLQTPLRVYSHDGQLLGEFGEQRRTPISYAQLPPQFVNAVLAAEDDRFYKHHGVDFTGLLRAASQLLVSGRIQTGGSTITMQVAKNYFLSHERTFARKFNEILLAIQIERELSKQDILELYLNKIFLGNRAYGVEAAAHVYYDKSITELNLAQWAMIAGLPKAPSAYNPLANPERALIRRNWILGRMLSLGYIDDASYQQAVAAPVTASYYGPTLSLDAPYVAEMVRQEMVQRFGTEAYTRGYRVTTTVDSELQRRAQQALMDGVFAYDRRHGYRGPERRLAAGDDPQQQRERWQQELRAMPTIAELRAAAVTGIAEQSFSAMLANGQTVEVGWEDGLSTLNPYIDVDRRAPRPKTAAEVVKVGDVVRLKLGDDGRWTLDQLPVVQASLVALDADSGAILSLVGGFDYQRSKFNRVTQSRRQPGSNFKPFLYAAALDGGATAATVINDAPVVFNDPRLEEAWRPTNSGGRFFGPTRLREGLYKSRNLVSIRLLQQLGIQRALAFVSRFGFEADELPRDLSLALGSHSLTPLSIARGFAVFANGGYRVDPYLIAEISGLDGELVFEARPPRACHDCAAETDAVPATEAATDDPLEAPLEEFASLEELLAENDALLEEEAAPLAPRVLEPRLAYIMDSLLKDVVERGTARRARSMGRNDLAGKTGTTNGPTDAWFSGYGGGVVTTTWVGFDQNQNLGRYEYGGTAALPIWIDFMETALKGRPERIPQRPPGLVTVRIDPETGQRAAPGQRNAIFEIFREEYAPPEMLEQGPLDSAPLDSLEMNGGDLF